MQNEVQTKLALLKIQVRCELPENCIGYADFLTEENFPATGQTANSNLLRLEELRPGTLAQFASTVIGI
jgi:hypothetical protein